VKLEKKRVRTSTTIILAVGIPFCLGVLGFCGLGAYLQNNESIYPNATIDGVDVSRLTKEEALQALDVQMYDERANNAEVTIAFPDGTELTVTGQDVRIGHDARQVVDEVYSI